MIVKKKIMMIALGTLIGATAGFFYWKFVGCSSGTCYIQSNPYRMTIYGAAMGGLLFNSFFK